MIKGSVITKLISSFLTFTIIFNLVSSLGMITPNASETSFCEGFNEYYTGNVNLTNEGSLDWKHFGATVNQKNNADYISDLEIIGNASNSKVLNDSKILYSWTDGTPDSTATGNTFGKYSGDGESNIGGFGFSVPSENKVKIINIYGSVWGATGEITAQLDDGTKYITQVDSQGEQNKYYHIRIVYRSETSQLLKISVKTGNMYNKQYGNISLQAATLSEYTKPIIILNGAKDITMSINEQFTDPFVKAYDNTGDITDLVTTQGEVKTNEYGKYTLKYNVSNGGLSADEVVRNIIIVPPELTATSVRDEKGNKTVIVTGATPSSTIKLYDNTAQCVATKTADNDGKATFEDLKSICYRVSQVINDSESKLSSKIYFEPDLNNLPSPILDKHPEWVSLYKKAWEFHKNNTRQSKEGCGITDYYVDENFDTENIYQWDILFMALFNAYGYTEFPGIDTLDNFYRYQEDNGFIARVIKEDGTGNGYGFTNGSYNAINPPLFAYVEWKYYQISGDSSRFNKKINGITVIEHLEKLFNFIKSTRTYQDGTYHTNGQANGMDNTPGYNVSNLSWVDLASQQAQSAYYIAKMAEVLSDTQTKTKYENEYNQIKNTINEKHWDSADSFYYMLNQSNGTFYKQQKQRTPMGWWPMAVGISDNSQAKALTKKYIMNPDEFWRPMGISTVSRQSSFYDNSGNYWLGGVWAPTEYMTNMALKNYGYYEEASQNAIHYINALNKVYRNNNKPYTVYTNSGRKVYDATNKYSNTIWEMYQPEYIQPGGVEDYGGTGDLGLVRKDFVGWTGVAPIAMLIEDVLGFTANAPDNTLEWRLNLTEKNGIDNFKFNDNTVDIFANERSNSNEKAVITVTALKPFKLKVNIGGKWYEKNITAGVNNFELGDGAASDKPVLNITKNDVLKGSAVDISNEGKSDWMICGFGQNKIERKNIQNSLISNWRKVGKTNTVKSTQPQQNVYNWTDGKTKVSDYNISSSISNYGSGQGFEFNVPADTTERILKVYVNSHAVDSKFNVEISDGSSTDYVDYYNPSGKVDSNNVFTIKYRASRDNQFLTVRYTADGKTYDGSNSSVALSAITLSQTETSATDNAGALINSIPKTVSLNDFLAIITAKNNYDLLSVADKNDISNEIKTKLETAVSDYLKLVDVPSENVPNSKTINSGDKVTLKAPSEYPLCYTLNGSSPSIKSDGSLADGTYRISAGEAVSVSITKTTTIKYSVATPLGFGKIGLSVITVKTLVSSIKMPKSITVNKGKFASLPAKFTPSSATNIGSAKWSTSDKKIVIFKNGKLFAKGAGKAYITVIVDGKTASCLVLVKSEVTKIKTKKSSYKLKVGKKLNLSKEIVVVTPKKEYAITPKYTYKISTKYKKYISLSKDGKVKAVKKGKTVYILVSVNNKKLLNVKIKTS